MLGGLAYAAIQVYAYWLGRRDYRITFEVERARVSEIIDQVDKVKSLTADEKEQLSRLLVEEAIDLAGRNMRMSYITIASAIAGLTSIVTIALAYREVILEKIFGTLSLIPPAFAQNTPQPPKADLTWMVPWIVTILLAVMAIAFLGSLLTLLVTKDIPENQSKVKAASDIVKTFGGFFTGIATTLLS